MTIRTFIFCDICNQRGIRTPEMRQGSHRDSEHRGRRVTDSRAWYEGEVKDAIAAGWQVDLQGGHVCPRCHQARNKTPKNYSPQIPHPAYRIISLHPRRPRETGTASDPS